MKNISGIRQRLRLPFQKQTHGVHCQTTVSRRVFDVHCLRRTNFLLSISNPSQTLWHNKHLCLLLIRYIWRAREPSAAVEPSYGSWGNVALAWETSQLTLSFYWFVYWPDIGNCCVVRCIRITWSTQKKPTTGNTDLMVWTIEEAISSQHLRLHGLVIGLGRQERHSLPHTTTAVCLSRIIATKFSCKVLQTISLHQMCGCWALFICLTWTCQLKYFVLFLI